MNRIIFFVTLDGIRATFHARSVKYAHYIFFTNSYNSIWQTLEGTMN